MEISELTNSFKRIRIKCPKKQGEIEKAIDGLVPTFSREDGPFNEAHYEISGTTYSVISKREDITFRIIELLV